MLIQRYDLYTIKLNDFAHIDINPIIKPITKIYQIRMFLVYSFGSIRRRGIVKFIEQLETIHKNGISFEDVDINIDNENNLVYFSESYHTYDRKPMTSEIENLLEIGNFIELCKIGFLNYITMTKENFIHILLTWNQILDQLPPFALLYQNEQNWYDVQSFETEEAMKQFVADHTQPN